MYGKKKVKATPVVSNEPSLINVPNDLNMMKADLTEQVDRESSIAQLQQYLGDDDLGHRLASMIEEGIFQFASNYVSSNNLERSIIVPVYSDKMIDIIRNLDPGSSIGDGNLLVKLREDQLDPSKIADMRPHELCPSVWQELLDRGELRRMKENNIETTDMFPCKKCGARAATVLQMQTRSADEPMTTFVTCVKCMHTFRF